MSLNHIKFATDLKEAIDDVMSVLVAKQNVFTNNSPSIKSILTNEILLSVIQTSLHKGMEIQITIEIHLKPCEYRYYVNKFDVYRSDHKDQLFLNGYRFLAHYGKGVPDEEYKYDPKDDNYLWLISRASDFVSMLKKFDEYAQMRFYEPVFNL